MTALVVGAVLGGLLLLVGGGCDHAEKCSVISSGDINGTVTQDCSAGDRITNPTPVVVPPVVVTNPERRAR
jgi:hypothetical protein